MTILRQSAVEDEGPKTYAYVAVSPAGSRVKARMTAPTAASVSSALQAEGWIPLEVTEVSDRGLQMDLSAAFSNRPLKLKPAQLATLSRQFNQLLKAGLSVPKALSAVGEEQEPKMEAMCRDLSEKVASGVPLSQAFAEYPSVFDDVFIAYIAAGETTGALQETTERLAKMLEKRSQLANKLKAVTAYPKLVSGAIGGIVTLIFLFLVPMYGKIYKGFGAKLPAPTRVVVAISNQMVPVSFAHPMSFVYIPYPNFLSPTLWIALLYFAVRFFLKSTKEDLEIGKKVDRLRYRLPIFGRLNAKTALFRWSSTLAGGLNSGVQQQSALELAARASGSRWQRLVLSEHVEAVRGGKLLSESLQNHRDLYPPNLRAMVATGEAAGELANMLENVSNTVDDEIDAIVAGLSAKLEVALLLVMGVVVGGLLIALYLPILNLATTVGNGLNGGSGF